MTYQIDPKKCLQCGVCVPKCPQKAIRAGRAKKVVAEFVQIPTAIDPKRCNDCSNCVSEEWWCPAQAISKA